MKGVPLVWIVFSNVIVLQRLARRRVVFARDNALKAGLIRTVKVIISSILYFGLCFCSASKWFKYNLKNLRVRLELCLHIFNLV